MEPPRSVRTQRLLPALAPAPLSSTSATAPHKCDRPHSQQLTASSCRSAATPSSNTPKPSSIAHIFFNRRPLDLIRRRTSSLLASVGTSSSTGVVATSPAAEERKFWQPHRPQTEKNGRWRLQHKDKRKDDPKQQQQKNQHAQRRMRGGDTAMERGKRYEYKAPPEVATEIRRRPTPCPLTGRQFLLNREKAVELTALERVEIQQYDEISFVSTLAVKRGRRDGYIQNDMPLHGDEMVAHVEEPAKMITELWNDGYDDEFGDYLVLMGDHLAFRYEVLSALGQGSFGQVVYCLDHRTCKHVAVKIIRNRQKYRNQALAEVQLLVQLQCGAAACDENPHVVRLEEYFQFRDHVCIVFEVLGANLYEFLKMRSFRGVSMSSVRTVGKKLAQALIFLKQQQVVHCDLKPENVLLDASSVTGDAGAVDNVTLIDFGSSCMEGAPMFTYIQSRFYRSPEVLLGHTCSGAIDMWSFACILAELYTGHPIFAGENECEQFACILEVLDVPSSEMVHKCKRRLHFFDEVVNPADMETVDYAPKPFVSSRGRQRMPGSRSLASVVMTDDSDFLAFLAKCFIWEPSERLTPEQVLREPWIRHEEEYEL